MSRMSRHARCTGWSAGSLAPVFSHYFEPLARGVQRAGVVGWYFTGRESALREIVTWLGEIGYGALIVTGEPGSGKSAVLARIVTMADAPCRLRPIPWPWVTGKRTARDPSFPARR